MFDPINLTPKEPLPNDELSAMHETYASFIYTLTCCYNSHVVLIMDAYVYKKFCKSRSCFALGQANDLKKYMSGEGSIFTNHVDKARIIKKKKSCLESCKINPQLIQIPRWMLLSSSN
jgi:hypothetical protein